MSSSEVARQLIAAMHADPEVASEVRRAVLTDELLGLPKRVSAIETRLDRVENALEQLVEAQIRTEARLDQVIAELAELRNLLGRFITATGEALERLVEAQTRTEARLDQVVAEVAELRSLRMGEALERTGQALGRIETKLDEHGIRLARIGERLG